MLLLPGKRSIPASGVFRRGPAAHAAQIPVQQIRRTNAVSACGIVGADAEQRGKTADCRRVGAAALKCAALFQAIR